MRIPTVSLLLVIVLVAACDPIYVGRAGWEQARILAGTVPLGDVIADPDTPPEVRAKLITVLQAREFAANELELDVGRSYTRYASLRSDTLVHVVTAAEPDRFRAHTWWFPVVGRMPYKGFFDPAAASREASGLAERGLDVHVRPVGAFSTLGWFPDPLYSSLLRANEVALANTVIHELLHNTIFLSGQGAFNESFANFVGAQGAIELFCREYSRQAECDHARAAWRDDLRFGRFLETLVGALEELYESDLPRERILAEREEVFADGRRAFTEEIQPRLEVLTFAAFAHTPLNNATLISRRLYYHRLGLFDRLHQALGGDLHRTIHTTIEAVRADPDDPYGAVEHLLEEVAGRQS